MRLIRKVHAFLGALLSLLFLVWFLSGFMMMYSAFPRVGEKDLEYKSIINGEALPSLEEVLSRFPKGEKQLRAFSLSTHEGVPVFQLKVAKDWYQLSADSLLNPVDKVVHGEWVKQYAQEWSDFPIQKIDTLYTLDPWTPYHHLKSELPIYRFKFADPAKTYLYISSQTGEPLQVCTQKQRLKSSLGTIPHMLYFWPLRQNRPLWITLVSVLAGLGALMTLTGILVGIQDYTRNYKRKGKVCSPYRKKAYRWHHQFGIVFGFFVMMFALSGLLSLNDLPSWMIHQHHRELAKEIQKNDPLDITYFLSFDYRKLMELNQVQEVTFQQFGEVPYYSVVHGGKRVNYRVDKLGHIAPLFLTEEEVKQRLEKYVGASLEVELLEEYDNYYCSNSGRSELPIYRVKANDPDKSVLYVSPTTGYTRYYNTSGRVKKWIYPAFHSLRIKFFAEHPLLRQVVMIILLLGGTMVSATGVWMGIRYYHRHFHRLVSKKKMLRTNNK